MGVCIERECGCFRERRREGGRKGERDLDEEEEEEVEEV